MGEQSIIKYSLKYYYVLPSVLSITEYRFHKILNLSRVNWVSNLPFLPKILDVGESPPRYRLAHSLNLAINTNLANKPYLIYYVFNLLEVYETVQLTIILTS